MLRNKFRPNPESRRATSSRSPRLRPAISTDIRHFPARVLVIRAARGVHAELQILKQFWGFLEVVIRSVGGRIRGPGGPKAVGCRAIMRPRRLMGTSCRPPIGWSQRGPGVRRPRVPSGLRETASPVPKCISSGVCPRKPEGARARLRIWLARRGIRGYECSGCGRRTWQVRDVRLRTWDDQVACSRLDELCTIICRTPDNNSFSSELPARRTRESEHLHYAYNRRVAGSNPA